MRREEQSDTAYIKVMGALGEGLTGISDQINPPLNNPFGGLSDDELQRILTLDTATGINKRHNRQLEVTRVTTLHFATQTVVVRLSAWEELERGDMALSA